MIKTMTMEEYRELATKDLKKPSKYYNIKTTVYGITFDSIAEANRYIELKQLLQAGVIKGFSRQPSFILNDGEKPIRYRPDFIVCSEYVNYGNHQIVWVEDVKGVETPEFKLKQKLWAKEYPWLELRIIK